MTIFNSVKESNTYLYTQKYHNQK